jgi:hypothetical protein
VRGKLVFQDILIAPPGTPVLVYESPHNRGSWAPHGVPGFYVGPALAHYCYTIFIPKTRKTRITDTLSWHPKFMVLPGTSAVKAVTGAAKDLETALLKLRKSLPFNATMRQPFDNMDNTLTATFNDMRALFATTPPTNTCDADLELSEDEHNAAQSEGCSLSRAAQSELFWHGSHTRNRTAFITCG